MVVIVIVLTVIVVVVGSRKKRFSAIAFPDKTAGADWKVCMALWKGNITDSDIIPLQHVCMYG